MLRGHIQTWTPAWTLRDLLPKGQQLQRGLRSANKDTHTTSRQCACPQTFTAVTMLKQLWPHTALLQVCGLRGFWWFHLTWLVHITRIQLVYSLALFIKLPLWNPRWLLLSARGISCEMLGKLALPGSSILVSQPKSVPSNPKIKRLYADLSHMFLIGIYYVHILLFSVQHTSIINLLIVSPLPLTTLQVQSNSRNTLVGKFSFIALLPTWSHWQEKLLIFLLTWAVRRRYTVVAPLLVFCR